MRLKIKSSCPAAPCSAARRRRADFSHYRNLQLYGHISLHPPLLRRLRLERSGQLRRTPLSSLFARAIRLPLRLLWRLVPLLLLSLDAAAPSACFSARASSFFCRRACSDRKYSPPSSCASTFRGVGAGGKGLYGCSAFVFFFFGRWLFCFLNAGKKRSHDSDDRFGSSFELAAIIALMWYSL